MKAIEILGEAVRLANEKLDEDLKARPRQKPFRWAQPRAYHGGSIRVYLVREEGRFDGCFTCSRRLRTMAMTWAADAVCERSRGPATVEFVLSQLVDVELPEEV